MELNSIYIPKHVIKQRLIVVSIIGKDILASPRLLLLSGVLLRKLTECAHTVSIQIFPPSNSPRSLSSPLLFEASH